jgi:hypothetical protein
MADGARPGRVRWAATPAAPAATLTALAATIAAIASQSAGGSDWPRTTRPVSAAKTGLTLMKTP